MKDHIDSWTNVTDGQRATIKIERSEQFFSTMDAWNGDEAICAALGNMLTLLADMNHGYPSTFPGGAEGWLEALRSNAAALHGYSHDTLAENAAQDAIRWIADHLGSLWD